MSLFTVADCAVCAEGYAPSIIGGCYKCTRSSVTSAVGLAVAVLALTLGLVIELWDLVAVVDGNGSVEAKQEGEKGFRKWKLSSCRSCLKTMFPVTSIKIVVVVWQILTQVSVVLDAEQCLSAPPRGDRNLNKPSGSWCRIVNKAFTTLQPVRKKASVSMTLHSRGADSCHDRDRRFG